MPNNQPTESPSYECVKNILNTIQGSSVPDYQGYRAFWLDLDTFKTIELYGQRLIAPGNEDKKGSTQQGTSQKGCCGSAKQNESAASSAVETLPSGPVTADCWPSGGNGGASFNNNSSNNPNNNPNNNRSDQSGIIKGLKGLYPFDGSIFPPLMWDAQRSAREDEIQYIANWIDDGCPSDKDANTPNDPQSQVRAASAQKHLNDLKLACGEKAQGSSGKCTNIDKQAINGLNVRKEISTLTDTELKRFRDALSCMYQYNSHIQDERSFAHWARIHTNSCQHGWEQFLPWHRLYLYFFEQTLQDFDPLITLPYWSWVDYADANKKALNPKKYDQGIIPNAYHCWLSATGYKKLSSLKKLGTQEPLFNDKELAGLEAVVKGGATYNSGLRFLKAANIEYQLININGAASWSQKTDAIYSALREENPLWFPNRWPGGFATSSKSSYPTQQDINIILAMNNWADVGGGPEYDHHYGAIEKVHNGMHNFSGGSNPHYPQKSDSTTAKNYQKLGLTLDPQNPDNPKMGWMTDNRVTAFDPIFWAHHSNVDRIWANWQEQHPGVNPEEPNSILAPWSLTTEDTRSTKKLGYEYMRDTFHYETPKSVGISKFVSEDCGVCQSVLDSYSKAEIRVHRVQRGNMENATIRLFINSPEATADTPTQGNDNFAGEFTTFHGSCYGGPGHCALPLSKTRKNDQRSLHHHEPRNFRVNATDTINKLLAKGQKDLNVSMVVTGENGEPVSNALYLDGISLNFFE